MHEIVYPKHFERDFKKLPEDIQRQVILKLQSLEKDPLKNCRKLEAVEAGHFRARCGNYRIRYDIDKKYIILHSVKHRKDIYRK